MSFEEVEEILQDSYGMDWREIFQNIEEKPLGSASIAQVMMDLMDVMKENKIIMPHGLTMLARGLTHIEGILADISPDINMIGIAATRIKGDLLHTICLLYTSTGRGISCKTKYFTHQNTTCRVGRGNV